jgi:hypothetical protein
MRDLKMEAEWSSESSVRYNVTTSYQNPEDYDSNCRFTFHNLVSLCKSVGQRPSLEANGYRSAEETPCALWKPKVHWRSYKTCHWFLF